MKSNIGLIFMAFLHSISNAAQIHPQNDGDIQLRNNSSHLDCFDVFIPFINRLASEAKESSQNCVTTAVAQKERELALIKTTRSELFSEVKRIKETLTVCSARNDHVGYFECLSGIIEIDKKIVLEIASKSLKYSDKIKEIEEHEIRCFRNSVRKVKDKSSNAINNLQYCLTSGNNLGLSTGITPTTPSSPTMKMPVISSPDDDDYNYS